MTTVNLAPTFGVGYQAFTAGGLPLNAGLLYTYSAGSTTPQATYTTLAANVQNANPIVLDADGRPPNEIWLIYDSSYRLDLKDGAGNLIKTYDNVAGSPSGSPSSSTLAGSTGSSLIGFTQAGTGAGLRTVQGKERDIVSITDFYANGVSGALVDPTGVTDSTLGIQAAYTACNSIYHPEGIYSQSATLYTRGPLSSSSTSTNTYEGKQLYGAGPSNTILRSKAGFSGSYMMHVGNKDWATDGNLYCIHNVVTGMTLDNRNVGNFATFSALFVTATYDNVFSNMHLGFGTNPETRMDLLVSDNVFTTDFNSVHGQNYALTASGAPKIGSITTIAFNGGSCVFLNLYGTNQVNLNNFTVQGDPDVGYPTNRIQFDQCTHLHFRGLDVEGNGQAFQGSNSTDVTVDGWDCAFTTTYNGGASSSKIWHLTNCDKVESRRGRLPNWTYADANYFTDGGGNQRMRLFDFAGDYYTGARYSVVNSGVAVSITNPGTTVVNFDHLDLDTGNLVTTGASWHFTAPVPGTNRYRVQGNIVLSGVLLSTDTAYAAIFVNGAEVARSYGAAPNKDGFTPIPFGDDVSASLAQQIVIKVVCTGGSATTIPVLATASYVNISFLDSY